MHLRSAAAFFALLTAVVPLLGADVVLFRTHDAKSGYFFEAVRTEFFEVALYVSRERGARPSKPVLTSNLPIENAFISNDGKYLIVNNNVLDLNVWPQVFSIENGAFKSHIDEDKMLSLIWAAICRDQPECAVAKAPASLHASARDVISGKAMMRARGEYSPAGNGGPGKKPFKPCNVAIDLATMHGTVVPDDAMPNYSHRKMRMSRSITGTGFWVGERELVTCAHVVRKAKQVRVLAGDLECMANVVALDEALDLALLRTEPNSLPGKPVKFVQGELILGTPLKVFGFPFSEIQGSDLKLTTGTLSGLLGLQGDSANFQLSAPVQPGNSGGPVMNEKNEVIGVAVARLSDMHTLKQTGSLPQNVNFGVHVEPLLRFLDKHMGARPASAAIAPDPASQVVQIITEVEAPAQRPFAGAGSGRSLPDIDSSKPPSLPPVDSIPRADPVAPSPAKLAEIERAMRAFATGYIEASNGDDAGAEIGMYGEECNYYRHGRVTRDRIAKEITSYRARWPQRNYTVLGFSEFESDTKVGFDSILVHFSFTLKNGRKTESGTGITHIFCTGLPDKPRVVGVISKTKGK